MMTKTLPFLFIFLLMIMVLLNVHIYVCVCMQNPRAGREQSESRFSWEVSQGSSTKLLLISRNTS